MMYDKSDKCKVQEWECVFFQATAVKVHYIGQANNFHTKIRSTNQWPPGMQKNNVETTNYALESAQV